MKKTVIVFMMNLMIFGLTMMSACRNQSNTNTGNAVEDAMDDDREIKIEITPTTFNLVDTEMEGRYNLINKSDYAIKFGQGFTLEQLVDNTWKDVPISLAIEDIALGLRPGEHQEFPLRLSRILENTAPGKYRLLKEIEILQSDNEKVERLEVVVAEFLIQ